jgi:hypothetical protein
MEFRTDPRADHLLLLKLMSVNNLRRVREDNDPISLYCIVDVDGVEITKTEGIELRDGQSMTLTTTPIQLIILEKSKVSVILRGQFGEQSSIIGRVNVVLSGLDYNKLDVRMQPLKKRYKKDLVGGELIYSVQWSRKLAVSGPVTISKPYKEGDLSNSLSPQSPVLSTSSSSHKKKSILTDSKSNFPKMSSPMMAISTRFMKKKKSGLQST